VFARLKATKGLLVLNADDISRERMMGNAASMAG
jgi:hypothetical protein